jgi:hypothetical protein
MGLPDKSAPFEFIKDYKSDAKKGEVIQGYYAKDWKDIEFRRVNSLGLISKVFYAPMSEIDITFKVKKPSSTPKPIAKDKKEKIDKSKETKPTDTTLVVEEKKSIFTTKNILIGVGGLVVLFFGIKLINKGK